MLRACTGGARRPKSGPHQVHTLDLDMHEPGGPARKICAELEHRRMSAPVHKYNEELKAPITTHAGPTPKARVHRVEWAKVGAVRRTHPKHPAAGQRC